MTVVLKFKFSQHLILINNPEKFLQKYDFVNNMNEMNLCEKRVKYATSVILGCLFIFNKLFFFMFFFCLQFHNISSDFNKYVMYIF